MGGVSREETRAQAISFLVDTGGTFTDCVVRRSDGTVSRVKVLSTSAIRGRVVERLDEDRLRVGVGIALRPGFLDGMSFRSLGSNDPPRPIVAHEGETIQLAPGTTPPLGPFEAISDEPAPVLAARVATGSRRHDPFGAVAMRLATTLGTNALLEDRGAPTALFLTSGFEDLLRIGTQTRPDLFALCIAPRRPITRHVVGVPGRIDIGGRELSPLALEAIEDDVERLLSAGFRVAALALVNAYRNPAHERALALHLRARGFAHVSVSSALSPTLGLLSRAETAAVDATLTPVVHGFLDEISSALGTADLRLMTSAGGLVNARDYHPKDSLLSGPAGGVVGAAALARRLGLERILALDMGGTSADVSRYDGDHRYRFEHAVGDAHLRAPALEIETVAAGGGSNCTYDERGLSVGPESAGADPGPAAYGAGGPLTLTDVNLLLGRLDPDAFEIPLDLGAARAAFEAVRARIPAPAGGARTSAAREGRSLLEAFVEIAEERMAAAIRRISVGQGVDPSAYALVAFGGAGGQHACGVATRLGIATVVVPDDAGVLSASGLGDALVERFAERQILRPLDAVAGALDSIVAALSREALDALGSEGLHPDEIGVRRRIARLRYAGQDVALGVDLGDDRVDPGALARAFRARHEALYGHAPPDRPVEVESIRAVASSRRPKTAATEPPAREGEPEAVIGPCVLPGRHATLVVPERWRGRRTEGAVVLVREPERGARAREAKSAAAEEIFAHRLTAIAEEMGERLRRSALSTNVKERLDFSCGVLDATGRLVVNAPHIPVHLGALGSCVRRVARRLALGPGDVAITNHPAFGGSHLPDVTLVTPVFLHDRLVGYVASRAHHAEIGGLSPGSMPASARTLSEEGVVFEPMLLVRGKTARWEEIESRLRGGPWPSRRPEENLADLRAQLAANHLGAGALESLARAHAGGALAARMDAIRARAARSLRRALAARPDGTSRARAMLDDGTVIAVSATIESDRLTIDFAGTSPVHAGNLNATRAIVRSAVVYVLRLLVGEPLPLNEGLLEPVTLRIPTSFLAPDFGEDPDRAPAVSGGNVETSQRLVDALVSAFGLAAASQGTMNNVAFGNERSSYYETVAGGAGAGEDFDGASAVHTHMTNTKITDPEVVEHRHPVRIERFAIRRGSGGSGRHRGGDGVVREYAFTEPVALSIVSQNRVRGPDGAAGGGRGAPGRQTIVRADGSSEELEAIASLDVGPGDRLVLETPGGGGWGLSGR